MVSTCKTLFCLPKFENCFEEKQLGNQPYDGQSELTGLFLIERSDLQTIELFKLRLWADIALKMNKVRLPLQG